MLFNIKMLIEGDYLIFVIGNLLADLGIAIFAIATVFSQKQIEEMLSYLQLMKDDNKIDDAEVHLIRYGFEALNEPLIDKVLELKNNLEQDKIYLKNLFKKIKKLRVCQKTVYFIFPIGIFIQVIALAVTRI